MKTYQPSSGWVTVLGLGAVLTAFLVLFGTVWDQDTDPAELSTPTSVSFEATTSSSSVSGQTSPTPTTTSSGDLILDGWEISDSKAWEEILFEFGRDHPEISVTWNAISPQDYSQELTRRLQTGTAGDLVFCPPYSVGAQLYDEGNLSNLADVAGLEEFSETALSGWVTADGTELFCAPVATELLGFAYNSDLFLERQLTEPITESDHFGLLSFFDNSNEVNAMVIGADEPAEVPERSLFNIGPNYWDGNSGVRALVEGVDQFTHQRYLNALLALKSWGRFLPRNLSDLSTDRSLELFTTGQSAIFSFRSGELSQIQQDANFEVGIYPPPVRSATQDTLYIGSLPVVGIGINARSTNPTEAQVFVEWLTSTEFGSLFAKFHPGFVPYSSHNVESFNDPLAIEVLEWAETHQISLPLSSGWNDSDPKKTDTAIGEVITEMWSDIITSEVAAGRIQDLLQP